MPIDLRKYVILTPAMKFDLLSLASKHSSTLKDTEERYEVYVDLITRGEDLSDVKPEE